LAERPKITTADDSLIVWSGLALNDLAKDAIFRRAEADEKIAESTTATPARQESVRVGIVVVGILAIAAGSLLGSTKKLSTPPFMPWAAYTFCRLRLESYAVPWACRSPGTWGQRSTFSPGTWGHRIAKVMGPGPRVIGPWIARVMGPVDRQGHGATP
jgi:hypothetical protein